MSGGLVDVTMCRVCCSVPPACCLSLTLHDVLFVFVASAILDLSVVFSHAWIVGSVVPFSSVAARRPRHSSLAVSNVHGVQVTASVYLLFKFVFVALFHIYIYIYILIVFVLLKICTH